MRQTIQQIAFLYRTQARHACSMALRLGLAIATIGLIPIAPALAAQEVLYLGGRADQPSSIRFNYTVEILKLALEKSKLPFTPVPVVVPMTEDRQLAEMREGKSFDVIPMVTNKTLEADLIPVRICLLKGLNGWRIPAVMKQNQDMLANVETLADLRKFSAGSGFTWIDTEVLQSSGIKVERTQGTNGLYKMLEAGRFDYFPRGALDITGELVIMKLMYGMDMVADTHILIRYPLPFYFFVRRDKPEVAEAIRVGLEAAIKDGSFDDLFYKFYGDAIANAHLEGRKIINLTNPQLTPETPLNRKNLWFSIEELKRRTKK